MLSSAPSNLTSAIHSEQTVSLLPTAEEVNSSADGLAIDVETTGESAADYDSIEDKYGGAYIWFVAISAALGGLLFGYDSTVISGVLVMVKDDLGEFLSAGQQEIVTSITSVGAFIGALMAGVLLDKIGRKAVIGAGALIFGIGSMLQAMASTVSGLAFGRLIVGMGIGEAAMVAPIYIAEISPARLRGALVTVDSLAITGGECVAGAVNIFLQDVVSGWRLSVGIAVVPSLILFGLCFVIPESPRSLIYQNKLDEACIVTQKIYPLASANEVRSKVLSIHRQFEEEAESQNLSTLDKFILLFSDSANFRALLVACGLMAIQQFSGSNSVFYYGPTLFGLIGFGNPIAISFLMALTNFVFTIFALRYIDTIGRRNFLVYSMWIMPISLIVTAAALRNIPFSKELTAIGSVAGSSGTVVLIGIVVFIASYAVALGNVPWQGNELFPMEVRAQGTMMLTLTNWSTNTLVASSFLSLMKAYTPSGTFAIYAATTFLGWLAVIYCYPEVSGLPLEDIKEVFRHGFGVKYSLKLQKERKASQELSHLD